MRLAITVAINWVCACIAGIIQKFIFLHFCSIFTDSSCGSRGHSADPSLGNYGLPHVTNEAAMRIEPKTRTALSNLYTLRYKSPGY